MKLDGEAETRQLHGGHGRLLGDQVDRVDGHGKSLPGQRGLGQLWNTEYVNVLVYQALDATLDAKATRQVKEALGKRLRFNPDDERALNIFGSAESQKITSGIVLGLKLVLGFIGVLTLAIGGVEESQRTTTGWGDCSSAVTSSLPRVSSSSIRPGW